MLILHLHLPSGSGDGTSFATSTESGSQMGLEGGGHRGKHWRRPLPVHRHQRLQELSTNLAPISYDLFWKWHCKSAETRIVCKIMFISVWFMKNLYKWRIKCENGTYLWKAWRKIDQKHQYPFKWRPHCLKCQFSSIHLHSLWKRVSFSPSV